MITCRQCGQGFPEKVAGVLAEHSREPCGHGYLVHRKCGCGAVLVSVYRDNGEPSALETFFSEKA